MKMKKERKKKEEESLRVKALNATLEFAAKNPRSTTEFIQKSLLGIRSLDAIDEDDDDHDARGTFLVPLLGVAMWF
jgi:hypothetical protein